MDKRIKLECRQVVYILLIVIYSTAEFVLSKESFESAKHDNWMISIVLGIFGVILGFIIIKLALKFKDKTIVEYSKEIVGNKLGTIIGLLYCIFFLQLTSIIIGEFVELLAGPFYPSTPLWFFAITIVMVASYVAYKGLGIIGRVADVIMPLYLIAIVMFPLLNIPNMDLSNVKPVLAKGIMPIIEGSKTGTIWYGELSVSLIIFPFLKKPKNGYKITIVAIISISLILTISAITLVAVFGDEIESLTNPYLELVRYIKISNSFERPESFLLFIWTSSLVIKIAVFFYCAVSCLSQVFKIKEKLHVVIATAIFLVILSLLTMRSSAFLQFLIAEILVIPYFIMQCVIPLILLISAKIKKVGETS